MEQAHNLACAVVKQAKETWDMKLQYQQSETYHLPFSALCSANHTCFDLFQCSGIFFAITALQSVSRPLKWIVFKLHCTGHMTRCLYLVYLLPHQRAEACIAERIHCQAPDVVRVECAQRNDLSQHAAVGNHAGDAVQARPVELLHTYNKPEHN